MAEINMEIVVDKMKRETPDASFHIINGKMQKR